MGVINIDLPLVMVNMGNTGCWLIVMVAAFWLRVADHA